MVRSLCFTLVLINRLRPIGQASHKSGCRPPFHVEIVMQSFCVSEKRIFLFDGAALYRNRSWRERLVENTDR